MDKLIALSGHLVETFRHQILASRLLKVREKVQESHGVIHIIADTLKMPASGLEISHQALVIFTEPGTD